VDQACRHICVYYSIVQNNQYRSYPLQRSQARVSALHVGLLVHAASFHVLLPCSIEYRGKGLRMRQRTLVAEDKSRNLRRDRAQHDDTIICRTIVFFGRFPSPIKAIKVAFVLMKVSTFRRTRYSSEDGLQRHVYSSSLQRLSIDTDGVLIYGSTRFDCSILLLKSNAARFMISFILECDNASAEASRTRPERVYYDSCTTSPQSSRIDP
jgi:hypothetical protein